MKRLPLAAVAVALLAVAGCSGNGGNDTTPTPATCAGTDQPGSVHVLQGGVHPLPGGGRAAFSSASMDETPPSVMIALLDHAPGERDSALVHVGDTVTVQRHRYRVVEICAGRVALTPLGT